MKILIKVFLFTLILTLLISCSKRQGSLLWAIERINDARITLYDVNTDGTPDLIVSGYQTGKKKDANNLQIGDSVVLIDGEKQKIMWKYATRNSVMSYPAVAYKHVFFGSTDNTVYSLKLKTGELEWIFMTRGEIYSSPAVYDGKVFIGSRDGYFYALDAKTGSLVWKYHTDRQIDSSPAISNNCVFFGSKNKCVYALDAQTGHLIWKKKLGGYIGASSLSTSNGKVFVGTWEGSMYALNMITGEIMWTVQTEGILEETATAIVGNTAYFGSNDGCLYAVNVKKGELKWKFKTDDALYSSPAVTSTSVYFTSRDGYFYALNLNGKLRWKFKAKLTMHSSPAIAKNIVYYGMPGGWFEKVIIMQKADKSKVKKFTNINENKGKPKRIATPFPTSTPKIMMLGSYIYAMSDPKMGTVKWGMKGGDPAHKSDSASALRYGKFLSEPPTAWDEFWQNLGGNKEEEKTQK